MKQFWCLFLLLSSLLAAPVFAQRAPLGIAEYVKLEEENVRGGMIVSVIEGVYVLSKEAYDVHIYGVVVEKPAVVISSIGRDQAHPVLSTGSAEVLVSTRNGAIQKGDYITSSDTPGIGMKSTQAGFIIGTAQADFTGEQGEEGLVPVVLDVKFITSTSRNTQLDPRAFAAQFQDVVTIGLRAVASEPNNALRYAAAALVLIASIAFGFLIFGRAATNGVTAVGRNPLAKKSIFAMVFFNVTMTVVFALAGVGLAVFILAA